MKLKKTEVMLQVAPGKEYVKPKTIEDKVKVGKSFTYLGSVILQIWSKNEISLSTKISNYNTSVLSAFLCVFETWISYKYQVTMLKLLESCLTYILPEYQHSRKS